VIRMLSPAATRVACRFNQVAGVPERKMLGLEAGEKEAARGSPGRLLRGLLIRLLPQSLPIIDRLAPSPVSMNRFLSYREVDQSPPDRALAGTAVPARAEATEIVRNWTAALQRAASRRQCQH
jgi:hypothetical protein